MTIHEAAKQVMRDAGKPLASNEIYALIVERKIYDFKARDPLQVLRSVIRSKTENIHNPSSSPVRHFRLVEGGKFIPLDSPKRIEVATESGNPVDEDNEKIPETDRTLRQHADNYNARIKRDLLESLKGLSWEEFERFTARILNAYGFEDVETTPPSGDKGIDGRGKLKVGLAKMDVAFQCKRWTGSAVGRSEIDRFRGAIQGESEQGIFFTTSKFASGAKKISIKKGAVPVILIDGEGIVDLMIDRGLGVQKDEIVIYSNALDLIFEDDMNVDE